MVMMKVSDRQTEQIDQKCHHQTLRLAELKQISVHVLDPSQRHHITTTRPCPSPFVPNTNMSLHIFRELYCTLSGLLLTVLS